MAQELQINPMLTYTPFIILGSLLLLVIYGIILFVKSKKVQSKSLKTGILIPLIFSIIGLLWWLADLVDLLDFGGFGLLGLAGGFLLISIISIIFSIIALIKIEKKSLAIGSLIYGIIYIVIWIILGLNFNGM